MPIQIIAARTCAKCKVNDITIFREGTFDQLKDWYIHNNGAIWLCPKHQEEFGAMCKEHQRIEDEWLGVTRS